MFPSCTPIKTRFLVLSGRINCESHYLAVSNVPFTLTPSLANFIILYSLKIKENRRFSEPFRVYQMGTLTKTGLKQKSIFFKIDFHEI